MLFAEQDGSRAAARPSEVEPEWVAPSVPGPGTSARGLCSGVVTAVTTLLASATPSAATLPGVAGLGTLTVGSGVAGTGAGTVAATIAIGTDAGACTRVAL